MTAFGARASMPAAAPAVGVDEHLGQSVPMEITFKDEDGKTVTLKSLMGKTTILTLVYYECPGICTPLLNNLADTLDRVDLEPGKDFQVVTISFDERDTPVMAAKKKANYLKQLHRPFPPEAWRFLTGDTNSIAAITEAVGFRYMRVGKDFNHPGVLTVLGGDGKVMRYLQGISFLPFDIKMAVIEAGKGRPMPTINRLLAFCYSYDPDGRKYVFSTLKVAGSVTLATLALFGSWLVISTRRDRKESAAHGN
jgi:protein SCO1